MNTKEARDLWTEERINILKEMWPNNSGAVIAAKLNQSRSAVLGKALRLKLPKKTTNTNEVQPSNKPPKLKFKSRKEMKSMNEELFNRPTPEIKGVKLMDLNSLHCRELVGMDDDCLPTYCGQIIVQQSYCAEHAAKNYRPNVKGKL